MHLFDERLSDLYLHAGLAQQPVRCLDVGYGFGELVAAINKVAHPESEVRGSDPCKPKVNAAQARGLSVTTDTLDGVGDE